MSHASEALAVARDGLHDAKTTQEVAAFRRWHAWAAFYAAYLDARAARLPEAVRTVASAMVIDPLWSFRLPPIILRHFMERKGRRGQTLG